jgi:hypothetical protein
MGASQDHKIIDEEKSRWLNLYLSNKRASEILYSDETHTEGYRRLPCSCFVHRTKFFFILLYLLSFISPLVDSQMPSDITMPLSSNAHTELAFETTRADNRSGHED